MTKLDTLAELETIIHKVGFIPKHQRALDFLKLLEENPDPLHYEPALAAAAVLSFYWEGMGYPDDGLDAERMYSDIRRINDLLNSWAFQVLKKLEAELSLAKGEGEQHG